MATDIQIATLKREYEAAKTSGHVFPDFAACEAMEESRWGTTECYLQACNPFGQKQQRPPVKYSGIVLPTWEEVNGHYQEITACFVQFPDRATAYRERMATLERLRGTYAEYEAALTAKTGEEYVTEVSKRWSTDTLRAQKAIEIHQAHKDLFV